MILTILYLTFTVSLVTYQVFSMYGAAKSEIFKITFGSYIHSFFFKDNYPDFPEDGTTRSQTSFTERTTASNLSNTAHSPTPSVAETVQTHVTTVVSAVDDSTTLSQSPTVNDPLESDAKTIKHSVAPNTLDPYAPISRSAPKEPFTYNDAGLPLPSSCRVSIAAESYSDNKGDFSFAYSLGNTYKKLVVEYGMAFDRRAKFNETWVSPCVELEWFITIRNIIISKVLDSDQVFFREKLCSQLSHYSMGRSIGLLSEKPFFFKGVVVNNPSDNNPDKVVVQYSIFGKNHPDPKLPLPKEPTPNVSYKNGQLTSPVDYVLDYGRNYFDNLIYQIDSKLMEINNTNESVLKLDNYINCQDKIHIILTNLPSKYQHFAAQIISIQKAHENSYLKIQAAFADKKGLSTLLTPEVIDPEKKAVRLVKFNKNAHEIPQWDDIQNWRKIVTNFFQHDWSKFLQMKFDQGQWRIDDEVALGTQAAFTSYLEKSYIHKKILDFSVQDYNSYIQTMVDHGLADLAYYAHLFV